ncbi:MAG TPA: 16S rRNA (uracil(1498)-N(3))-methyltransferase [Pyrinomonadaceae bacterium]|jgi:16S rRNA (uracil1498-N3)-methyltransferase|nr:16S rRNA (uracil(1498)-N(3))-methyltransferase [Pyrinomonadaceae bacterium]
MRRRFYAPPDAFSPDGATVVLAREETLHLLNVLRLKAGDEAFVFDGAGREYACVVARAGEGGRRAETATLEVRGEVEPQRPESPLDLTLAVALLKGEKFDLVVQKATELGVWRIVPVATKRADVRLMHGDGGRDAGARVARWRRLALEAAKQSGRARLPEVCAPVEFAAFVAAEAGAAGVQERRLFFTERGGRGLSETVHEWRERPAKLIALVGAEGGWDDAEIARAADEGWLAVTFGGRVLRAETAAIVVTGLLQHLYGDLV